MAAGVSAYLIKTDLAKLDTTEMAHYVEERIGNTITTAWNLNVKDVEQTISGVCQRVSLPFVRSLLQPLRAPGKGCLFFWANTGTWSRTCQLLQFAVAERMLIMHM